MDSNSMVGQILNPPIIARYIRIHPKAWYGHICMRVELFGCKEGTLIEMTYCISGLDHLGYITAISIRGNKYSVLGTEFELAIMFFETGTNVRRQAIFPSQNGLENKTSPCF